MPGNPDLDVLMSWLARDPRQPIAMVSNPLLAQLGAELVAYDATALQLTMRFAPPDSFRQGAGVVQGGILGAMLDFAMTLAAFAALPANHVATTTTLNTAFLAPATGTQYLAVARIDKPGRRVVFASSHLSDGRKDVATASASLLVLPLSG